MIFLHLLWTEIPNQKFLLVFSMMSDSLDLVSIMMVYLTVWHLTSWQLEWLSRPAHLGNFKCKSLPKPKLSGLYHHKSLTAKSSTDIPWDSKSATFSFTFSWFHFPGADNLWISLILFYNKWFKLSAMIFYPPQNIHAICPVVYIHVINLVSFCSCICQV